MKKFALIAILVVVLLTLTAPMVSASGGTYHTVRYGETLYSIGRYYGVSHYHIADVNNLSNPNRIYAGQVLYIPTSYQDGCHYPCNYDNVYYDGHWGANYHVVSYGETLTSIAYRYGVSPWALASANRIYNLNRIYAGQRLYIPSGGYQGYYDGNYQGYYQDGYQGYYY
jgi:LysM repeat protein